MKHLNRVLFLAASVLGLAACAMEPADASTSGTLVSASECVADTAWVEDWNSDGVTRGYGERDRVAALASIPRAILWESPQPPPPPHAAPAGCPDGVHDHCIWLCTGGDPLDGIGDNCSGDWCCPGCPGGDSSNACP